MKISIIVPVYNTGTYIKKCLDSLINQTLKDIEIIVINDHSTDNSSDILKEYENKIILINNKVNYGIGKTRNIGIEKATGEFITFIDSDDYIDTTMMEKCYNFAIKNNLDIVVCNYVQIYENGSQDKFIISHFEISNISENKELLFKINSGPCNKIFKKSLFDNKKMRFPENLKYEDFGIVPLLIGEAKRIGHLKEFLHYYVVHKRSETTSVDKKVFDIFKILDIINNYYKNKNIDDVVEYLNIEKIVTYTISQRVQNDKKLINNFIDVAFNYINKKFPNWKKNKYYNKKNVFKRIIEKNKLFTKIYCNICKIIKK